MRDDVLAANRRFYAAFAAADYAAMDELWARAAVVTCVHPGWTPLVGRDVVMQSWAAILASATPGELAHGDAEAFAGADLAYVVCSETIGEAELIATNVFVREGEAWKLVHHQAGPVLRRRPSAAARPMPN